MDLICGINPVIEALQAGTRHFDRLLIAKGIRNRRISEAIARSSRMGIHLRFEPRETLDRMAGGLPHQGIIAVVSAKPIMGLDDLLQSAHAPGLLVVLDGVQDPRNLGAILRTSEAAGVDGVLLPERHSAGLNETVGRASAGAIEHVRVARIGNLVQSLQTLKSRGYWIVGFDGGARERWDAVDYRRSVALVFGGEGRGIRRLVREHCDHLVAVPLFGQVASLNVSVAAGVGLYEVIRQRGAVPSHVRPIPLRPASSERRIVGPGPEDGEQDPGLSTPAVTQESEEPVDEPVGIVSIDEEAWTAPTVLRHAGQRRFRPNSTKGRRRRGRGPIRRAPPSAPQAEATLRSAPNDTAEPVTIEEGYEAVDATTPASGHRGAAPTAGPSDDAMMPTGVGGRAPAGKNGGAYENGESVFAEMAATGGTWAGRDNGFAEPTEGGDGGASHARTADQAQGNRADNAHLADRRRRRRRGRRRKGRGRQEPWNREPGAGGADPGGHRTSDGSPVTRAGESSPTESAEAGREGGESGSEGRTDTAGTRRDRREPGGGAVTGGGQSPGDGSPAPQTGRRRRWRRRRGRK